MIKKERVLVFILLLFSLTITFLSFPSKARADQCEGSQSFPSSRCKYNYHTFSYFCESNPQSFICAWEGASCLASGTVYTCTVTNNGSSCSEFPNSGPHHCSTSPDPTSTPVRPAPTSTPIPTSTPVPPPGECSENCRDVGDSTCSAGSCGACGRRTGIKQCDGNGDGTWTNCQDYCSNDLSCCSGTLPPTSPPTCTILAPDYIYVNGGGATIRAQAIGVSDVVRRIEIWRAQENWLEQDRPQTGWKLIGEVTNASGVTSLSKDWAPTMNDVTYLGNKWWVVCNAYYSTDGSGTNTTRCSGNPWGVPGDWADCGPNDNKQVAIDGWVQGRIVTDNTDNDSCPYQPYYKANCSLCPSCLAVNNIQVSCSAKNTIWSCDSCGAFYGLQNNYYDVGQQVTCSAINPPSGSEFTRWTLSNNTSASGTCSGSQCTATFNVGGGLGGANNLWFYVKPSPTPTPTPANSPPAVPTLSSPANGAICQNTSLTLSWNGVSSWGFCFPNQNNRYLVYVDNNSDFGSPEVNGAATTSTSYTASLAAGTTYYWKVVASNGCLTASSLPWSFTTKPNPPPNPTCSSCTCNVASAPEAATTCTVGWSDVLGADHYPFRADDTSNAWSGTCAWTYPGDVCLDAYSSSHSFNALGGHTYNPWVHTVDSCGQWSSGVSCPVCTAPACPAKPSGLTATRNGCNVVLSWTDNSTNEENFVIQRKLDGGAFLDWKTVGVGVTGITDSNVFCGSSPAATAAYQVSAVNTTLNCPRNYSEEASASCPLTISNFNISDHSVVITMGEGPEPAFSYQVTFECGAFNRIEFTGYDSSLITVDPVSSNNQQGIVNITASSSKAGTTTITATAYLNPGGVKAGTDTVTVTVEPPPAWWQTKDGDVHGNTNITSMIPDLVSVNNYLSLPGSGGDPGVVSYGSSLELDGGSVSEKGWQAKTTYRGDQITYDYLKNRLKVNTSSDTFNGTMPQETGTYFASSTKTLTGSFPSGKKIVIFVNGDVTVKNDVVVPPGSFFALIAKGNLTFESSVTKAQGFYLADGTLKVASGNQLFAGEGSFIGWSEVILQRDLGGSSSLNLTPSEFFTFRPDLLINAPKEFLFKPFVFQEVAP